MDPKDIDVTVGVNGLANGTEKAAGNSADQSDGQLDKKAKENKEETKVVGIFEMFKYASKLDVVYMVLGTLCATGNGAGFPLLSILFGEMVDVLVDSGKFGFIVDTLHDDGVLEDFGLSVDHVKGNPISLAPHKENLTNITDYGIIQHAIDFNLLDEMRILSIYFTVVGCCVIVFGYGQVTFWMLASEKQTHRIRTSFLWSVLRQNIGWFDTQESGQINSRLSEDINCIHNGIGDKLGHFTQWFMSAMIGFVLGFVYGWKLTLVILAISPLLALTGVLEGKVVALASSAELDAYAKAGSIAEEVFGAIRTVTAFGGQEKESERYDSNLIEARKFGIRKGLVKGASLGAVWVIMFGAYGLGFWYGAKLTRDEPDEYTIGRVIIVFFAVLIAAYSLGTAAPYMHSFSVARGAAYVIYTMIEQVPPIDSSSKEGRKLDSLQGNIELRGVHFQYPSRPDVQVLTSLDLKVNRGETVALVGPSGCGKSTVVQLVQRFYDPSQGQVLIDGVDVRELNLQWLRQHIGIVSQEPVLFGTTIVENIRYGRDGVTQQEIEAAAIKANAHDFILTLPKKYETMVGERGAQLSGGQKQRIAIARALVRDPKILLLDEATSALDNESEGVVQEALEKAAAGRTTIVVAHRLSTIQTADMIAGFKEGTIVEKGTHEQLMQSHGVYQQLVTMQTAKTDEDLEAEEFEEEENRPKALSISETKDKDVTKEKDKSKDDGEKPDASLKRILRMNVSEWYLILLGCIGALFNGAYMPVFAFIFAEIIAVFGDPDPDEQKDRVTVLSLLFLAIGVFSFFTNVLQAYMFGRSGEYLTQRLRSLSFKAMLRQNIAYFDDHDNSVGALTTRLATDASQVQGASGVRLGTMIMTLCCILTGTVIAFVYSWKLTLVTLCFLPFVFVGGALMMQMTTGAAGKDKEALEAAGKVAVEAIENIRTVASLTREDTFYQMFLSELDTPFRQAIRKAHVIGIAFSVSQGVLYFAYAASFYYGAYLVQENEIEFDDIFKVFMAIVFGAMGLGQASSFAPDAAKAQLSADQIFKLLDKESNINPESRTGTVPSEVQFAASVTFTNVKFRYPTRPEVQVLSGLNLTVTPGQTVALVGSSGCGKSTTVQLIERFYDAEDGQVAIGQNRLTELNVQWLRSKIGIVSQEPMLFDRSIRDNIAYGDNTRDVPMSDIIAAARDANIHEFITSLPGGYDTNVGEKGAQLSGGQKQRVAIARALLRNPKMLLLDEATSALDSESEKIVQEALDKASKGRTCIVIAHRLSTVQNADRICVIRHGVVTEEGTHNDLMKQQGFYYKLNMIQARKK